MNDNKLEKFYKEVVSLFPNINTHHFRSGTEENSGIKWNNHHFNIPSQNSNLYKSSYYYSGHSVVHFTSLYSLESILSEGLIRLYNLSKLNDPREFVYASRVFKLSDSKIKDAKENFYLISFCDPKILHKDASSEFNMWRLYGSDGKGVGIKFSLDNDPQEWLDFHLSSVKYGLDNRDLFVQLFNLSQEMSNEEVNVDIDLSKLCMFHKSNLYKVEKEIRLIFDRREIRAGFRNRTIKFQDKLLFPKIKYDIFKLADGNDGIRYLEIPIRHSVHEEYEPILPIFKIEEIILGYNLIEKTDKLIDHIKELCDEKLGYEPKVYQTRLKNFYWDKKK